MADKSEKKKDNATWGSVEGVVIPASVVKDEKGVAAKVQVTDAISLSVKGYGDKFGAMVEAAAKSGESVVFRGQVLGSAKNNSVHLSVKSEGPAAVVGEVSNIRRSGEGKQPYVNFFVLNEVTGRDGKEYKIGTAAIARGDAALALADLKTGDRVSFDGREDREKDDNNNYREYMRVLAVTAIEPAAAPQPDEDDAPAP